jgi:hypothetical protein
MEVNFSHPTEAGKGGGAIYCFHPEIEGFLLIGCGISL